jgi:hypothetical protein
MRGGITIYVLNQSTSSVKIYLINICPSIFSQSFPLLVPSSMLHFSYLHFSHNYLLFTHYLQSKLPLFLWVISQNTNPMRSHSCLNSPLSCSSSLPSLTHICFNHNTITSMPHVFKSNIHFSADHSQVRTRSHSNPTFYPLWYHLPAHRHITLSK